MFPCAVEEILAPCLTTARFSIKMCWRSGDVSLCLSFFLVVPTGREREIALLKLAGRFATSSFLAAAAYSLSLSSIRLIVSSSF